MRAAGQLTALAYNARQSRAGLLAMHTTLAMDAQRNAPASDHAVRFFSICDEIVRTGDARQVPATRAIDIALWTVQQPPLAAMNLRNMAVALNSMQNKIEGATSEETAVIVRSLYLALVDGHAERERLYDSNNRRIMVRVLATALRRCKNDAVRPSFVEIFEAMLAPLLSERSSAGPLGEPSVAKRLAKLFVMEYGFRGPLFQLPLFRRVATHMITTMSREGVRIVAENETLDAVLDDNETAAAMATRVVTLLDECLSEVTQGLASDGDDDGDEEMDTALLETVVALMQALARIADRRRVTLSGYGAVLRRIFSRLLKIKSDGLGHVLGLLWSPIPFVLRSNFDDLADMAVQLLGCCFRVANVAHSDEMQRMGLGIDMLIACGRTDVLAAVVDGAEVALDDVDCDGFLQPTMELWALVTIPRLLMWAHVRSMPVVALESDVLAEFPLEFRDIIRVMLVVRARAHSGAAQALRRLDWVLMSVLFQTIACAVPWAYAYLGKWPFSTVMSTPMPAGDDLA